MNKLDFYPASPVASDRWLFPDELPFTAFGQYGFDRLDSRVFEQDIWWVDRSGQENLLTEMTSDYLRAVKFHQLTFGESYHTQAIIRYSIETILAHSEISKQMLLDFSGFRNYVEGKANPSDLQWLAWLEATPLYRRIEAILESRA